MNDTISAEKLLEMAIAAGAEDVRTAADHFAVITSAADYANVAETLATHELPTLSSGIQLLPIAGTEVHLQDERQSAKVRQLIATLEEHDDIQAVYTNLALD